MDILIWNCSISMSLEAFHLVNVPLSVVSILMDIFFVFCMVFPQQGQPQMKQPLNVLVGSLVGCNTALHFCVLLFVISGFTYSLSAYFDSVGLYYFTAECLLFTMRTSVTSYLWLNVFYYCQIVPAKHSLLILLRKNIRLFVYSALIFDKFIFLYGVATSVVRYLIITPYTTTYEEKNAVKHAVGVDFWSRLVYFLFSLCVMLTSSCATVLYLWRHMKNMEDSSRSSPHLQSQMRVTITGIVQILLYFLCSVWLIIDDIAYHLASADFDSKAHIICTVITLYSFGTNINLGVGQSIFRERILLFWQ
ncbi:uncharacterized protein LOC108423848 [Pygocentrus nattereri]|uniref:uncharacterized protein LOC108423848 n=1 Tax=Pygocentrus nattereri TaxID=42514 RepID=UPI001891096E|nr:uncharacterized protein LOC108423848 [Pygocentrus nattereri]